MRRARQAGFTLIEVIVVAGIIAILAGILVPLIFKEIDESKITRASADIRSISSALIVLKKDTGQWPVSATCTPDRTILQGTGIIPDVSGVTGWTTTTAGFLDEYLMTDDNSCWPNTWKGPYMANVTMDPWGHAYIINSDQFSAANSRVWILSAGPNGLVDTMTSSDAVQGDDVAARLK